MNIYWTKDLSVGVESIDQQHKEIIKRINLLVDSCATGSCKDEAHKLLNFLHDYLGTHFDDEEALMRETEYPNYDSHIEHHKLFLEKMTAIEERLASEGPSSELYTEFNYTVIDLFIDHMCTVDRALGKYVLALD